MEKKYTEEITKFERKLIRYIRDLQFGDVTITIVKGKPINAKHKSTERWEKFDLPD